MQRKLVSLVVIGASTGGTRVLPYLFERVPRLPANILIVQHMPAFISSTFATTLKEHSHMPVKLVEENDTLEPGVIFLVPGDKHCTLSQNHRLHLSDGPKVNYVRPSVDVTMFSVHAPEMGGQLAGVILTGMGEDGAAGLKYLKGLGATTIAQDRASCAVFGMPKRAIETGCVDYVLPPDEIARWLTTTVGQGMTFRLGESKSQAKPMAA